jgi:type II secretory pathway component PulJ
VKRTAGWTLLELMVVVVVGAGLGGTVLGASSMVHREERLAAACATDLTGLRRAVRVLENDLRQGRDPAALGWRLTAEGALQRGDRVLARNVAHFELERDGSLTTVYLALGPRSDAPHRREAALELRVRARASEGDR